MWIHRCQRHEIKIHGLDKHDVNIAFHSTMPFEPNKFSHLAMPMYSMHFFWQIEDKINSRKMTDLFRPKSNASERLQMRKP